LLQLPDLPYAHGAPGCSGVLRTVPEDFIVEEDLGFAPEGAGEHLFVQVRKRGANTAWVAGWLAKAAGVRERDIGFAGMKDRQALTTQWFSLPLGRQPEPAWPQHSDIEILQTARHGRKLRRGALAGNRFVITVRQVTGDSAALAARAEAIRARGVPNYFGEQRFGYQTANLARAADMFAGRRVKPAQRSLYLSAARSYLFNKVLAARVAQGNWNALLPGEAVMLAGSHSFFSALEIDEVLHNRLVEQDVHPSGPLWGRGENPAMGAAGLLEQQALENEERFRTGLEMAGLKQERRALRLMVPDFVFEQHDDNTVQCRFSLPAGCYATSVLRELIDYEPDSK